MLPHQYPCIDSAYGVPLPYPPPRTGEKLPTYAVLLDPPLRLSICVWLGKVQPFGQMDWVAVVVDEAVEGEAPVGVSAMGHLILVLEPVVAKAM